MPGRGPVPKPPAQRRSRHVPQRGEWRASPGVGWQHGPVPDPPDGLCPTALWAWTTWMQSWIAANWGPEDVPGLYQTVQLYDQCQRYFADPYVEKETRKGDTIYVLRPNPATELRQMMDNYGITKRGQQDRRWQPPKDDERTPATDAASPDDGGRYGHLSVAK